MAGRQVEGGLWLLRGASSGNIKSSGRVRAGAFAPRPDGSDNDGLSVSVHQTEYIELHKSKYLKPTRALCKIEVDAVRRIEESGTRPLDAVEDPILDETSTEYDPAHALIIGMPKMPAADEIALGLKEHLARQLALAAQPFDFGNG